MARKTPLDTDDLPKLLRPRQPFMYLLGIWVVIGLGLASRRYASALPAFVATYAGDVLWAVMVFGIIGMLATEWTTRRVAIATLLVTYAVEFSQMYQAPWLEFFRRTGGGGFVLGYGFLWSDLVCYAVGVILCAAVELRFREST